MVESIAMLDRDQEARDYRPLALLSVVAFAVAAIFTLVVVVLTIVGLVTRKPFLEPWLIPLSFSGVLLSIAARWQIALSEGTREGRRLVNIAWWLSLVGGAMYCAYYFGNMAAIQSQARRFAREALLAKLKEQNFDAAFAATIEPKQRKGMNLVDVKKRFGDIVAPFRLEPLPRLLERANGVAEFEDAGTPEWKQASDGLLVVSRFIVRTPEGKFEANIAVVGNDNPETGEREWYIQRKGCGVKPMAMTTYGGLMSGIQEEADAFLGAWLHEKRFTFRRVHMFYDTLPMTREERVQAIRLFELKAIAAPALTDLFSMNGTGALVFASMLSRNDEALGVYTQVVHEKDSYNKLASRLVEWDESKQKVSQDKKDYMLTRILMPEFTQGAMSTAMIGPQRTNIEILPDRLRASMPLEVSLPLPDPKDRYRSLGRIYIDCTDPEIVREFNQRKSIIDTEPDKSSSILKSAKHDWKVSKLVIDLARDNSDMRPANNAPGKVEAAYPSGGKK